jgi:hypothetical protein
MRRIPVVRALIAVVVRRVRAREDEGNVRRLARHLDCSTSDARSVYRLARERGYGAAYVAVFGAKTNAPRLEQREGSRQQM